MRASPAHAYNAGIADHRDAAGQHGREHAVVPVRRARARPRTRRRRATPRPGRARQSKTATESVAGRSSPRSANATRAFASRGFGAHVARHHVRPSDRPSAACARSRRAAPPTTPARSNGARDRSRRRARRAARARRRRGTSGGSGRRRPRRSRSPIPTGPGRQRGEQRLDLARRRARRGVEHVLVRPQPERARHHVGVQEPGPQHFGPDEVPVVAARADRRDVLQPAHLREVGRRRHAPLRVQVARAEPGVDALLPRRGPARARAARARRGSTRSASRARTPPRPTRRPGRAAARRARGPADARGRRRPTSRTRRRTATATTDAGSARPAAAGRAVRAARRCRRAARRRAAPSAPCRSAARPTRRCRTGAAPRADTTTSRAAPRPRARRAPRGRRPRATTVDAASRSPARCGTSTRCRCRSSTTAACRARRSRARRAATPDADAQQPRPTRRSSRAAPSPAMTASSVANPAGTSSMSPCQPARSPVPACSLPGRHRRSPARGTPASGASSIVRPSGATSPSGMHDRGPERQQPPTRHRRVAEHRQRELRVLVPERPQPFRARHRRCGRADRSATRPPAWRSRRSRSLRRLRRFQAQHDHGLVCEHTDLADHPPRFDPDRARRVREVHGRARRGSPTGRARANRARPGRSARHRRRSRRRGAGPPRGCDRCPRAPTPEHSTGRAAPTHLGRAAAGASTNPAADVDFRESRSSYARHRLQEVPCGT